MCIEWCYFNWLNWLSLICGAGVVIASLDLVLCVMYSIPRMQFHDVWLHTIRNLSSPECLSSVCCDFSLVILGL